jgi:hypothetical protein
MKALERELRPPQGAGPGGGSGAADAVKKSPGDLGGGRGRMIGTPSRQRAIELIEKARAAGARLAPACERLDLSVRTVQRWTREPDTVREDARPTAPLTRTCGR